MQADGPNDFKVIVATYEQLTRMNPKSVKKLTPHIKRIILDKGHKIRNCMTNTYGPIFEKLKNRFQERFYYSGTILFNSARDLLGASHFLSRPQWELQQNLTFVLVTVDDDDLRKYEPRHGIARSFDDHFLCEISTLFVAATSSSVSERRTSED